MILSIVLAVIVVSVLVVSHEFGHFLLAKKNGIGVVEFSVGMGPQDFKQRKRRDPVFPEGDSLWRLLSDGGRG